jgi:hypothetical protein
MPCIQNGVGRHLRSSDEIFWWGNGRHGIDIIGDESRRPGARSWKSVPTVAATNTMLRQFDAAPIPPRVWQGAALFIRRRVGGIVMPSF